MIYIAHRGLFDGPNPERENHPDQIKVAFAEGFDCEIDLRLVDGKWLLGHDEPTHEVSEIFLRQVGLWIHCKNLEALVRLGSIVPFQHQPNYFWHQNDDFALTSNGYIWTYPGQKVDQDWGINVLPELNKDWRDGVYKLDGLTGHFQSDVLPGVGVCSKFVSAIRSVLTGQ